MVVSILVSTCSLLVFRNVDFRVLILFPATLLNSLILGVLVFMQIPLDFPVICRQGQLHSSFLICMHCFYFSCCSGWNVQNMLSMSCERNSPASQAQGKGSVFTVKDDVSSRFCTCSVSVEEVPFWSQFVENLCHEWVFDFAKSFFYISYFDHMIFLFNGWCA